MAEKETPGPGIQLLGMGPSGRRKIERAMSRVDHALEGKRFASEEEANAYLQKVVEAGDEVDRLWDGDCGCD